MKKILSEYIHKDIKIIYIIETLTNTVGFTIIPSTLAYCLEGEWKVEPLIQLKVIGDPYPAGFSGGHTMRNSKSAWKLKYQEQEKCVKDGRTTIKTMVKSEDILGTHVVTYGECESIEVWSEIENIADDEKLIEMLSTFSVCGLFGTVSGERTKDFKLHRLRSKWCEEGRLDTSTFLELQLEPSWQKYGVQSIRYGQTGSMPVRRFFPWFALEDKSNHCLIGGSLSIPSSWQIEVFSEDERPAISGGIADREFGHWIKQLESGERFVTPISTLTCCVGTLDDISNRIVSKQRENRRNVPKVEQEMPIVFNEFCTSWGCPSAESVKKLANQLKGKGIKYFVIDAGWHADEKKGWESNMGDWNTSKSLFPKDLKQAADFIREAGMIPGIWFEVETAGRDADIYSDESMLLLKDGYPITTSRRRFFDMRKTEVKDYLAEKVIGCIKDNDFGYLKVDYNDTIGMGCDGKESIGENLRVHMENSKEFYRSIKREMPELVMENCSSGGHRLEPSFMEQFEMASFSDAHECVAVPIIAANVHRAIQPAQSQIWAVIRKDAVSKRLRYLMTATFLGRMCLSGDIDELSKRQWDIIEAGMKFYKNVGHIIRDGKSYRYGPCIKSYANPEGYQILVRKTEDEALIVVHSFSNNGKIEAVIDLSAAMEIKGCFGDVNVKIGLDNAGHLEIEDIEAFDGFAIWLKR